MLGFLSVDALRPPDAVPADASPAVFSSGRAMAHVEAIARAPRPMGSDEHARVRAYLVEQLEALGLEVELETATVVRPGRGPVRAGRASNVVGRWPAGRRSAGRRSAGSGALRLVTHYDTVATSPGAADSAAGLAAILETVRALTSDGGRDDGIGDDDAPARDLVVVFTDGEEAGRLGARAHVRVRPAEPGDVVLNFEARGTRGPSLMFETSAAPRPLLERFFAAVDEPRAWSYSDAVYEWMPNYTDFTVFERAGYQGLNFAFIGGASAYHGSTDTPDRLDPRSLQHHGDQALALARAFLAEHPSTPDDTADGERHTLAHRAGGAVYFDLLGLRLAFPQALLPPVVVILVALVPLLLVFEGARRRSIPGRSKPRRVLVRAAMVAGSAVLLALVLALATPRILGGDDVAAEQIGAGLSRLGWLSLGAGALAFAAAVGLWRLSAREQSTEGSHGHDGRGHDRHDDGWLTGAGALVVWALLTFGVSIAAPGAAYLFALPLLLALLGGVAGFGGEGPRATTLRTTLIALTLAITVVLWAPTAYLTLVALGSTAVPGLAVVAFLLLAGTLRSTLEPLAALGRWLAPVAAIAGLALVVFAAVLPAQGGIVRGDHLLYSLDTSAPADDPDRALWVSHDTAPSPWTVSVLGEQPRRDTRPSFLGPPRSVLLAPAPVLPVGGGTAETIELERIELRGDARRLHLRLRWPECQHRATIFLRTEGEVSRLAVDGQVIEHLDTFGPGSEATRLLLFFEAPPAEGLPLTVDLRGEAPLAVDAVGQRYALPPGARALLGERPEGLRPTASWTTDSTHVRSVAVIEPGEGGR